MVNEKKKKELQIIIKPFLGLWKILMLFLNKLNGNKAKDPSGISNIIFKHNIASENLLEAEQMPTGIFCLTIFTVFIMKKFQEKIYTGSFLQLMFLEFHQLEHPHQHYL